MKPKPMTMKEIGASIRRARRALNLRQAELAGVAGVGVRFLIEVEGGKPTVQMGKVLRVLEVLGCEVSLKLPPEADEP